MRKALIAGLATLIVGSASARAAERPIATEEEKTFYALGRKIGQGLSSFELSPRELEVLTRGVADGARGAKPAIDVSKQSQEAIDALAAKRSAARATREHARGKAFAEKAAREKGAIAFDSGLVFQELKAGTGAAPSTSSRVTVSYRGTLVDGTEIDSTQGRSRPTEFPLGPNVIPCWTEGLLRMKAGGKARFVCPASLAYGEKGRYPNVPPGATVSYEFELLKVETR